MNQSIKSDDFVNNVNFRPIYITSSMKIVCLVSLAIFVKIWARASKQLFLAIFHRFSKSLLAEGVKKHHNYSFLTVLD